ncbi:hypothetical protein [Haliangium ochraceum]|uniref:Uncharacterized protein n=1 Tax=Haliangium ochraceum (strain DSM 14365 / JCM 11303 / SMP-2) TaxID=502025 RepID=D0LLQ4_HALO1|nr:hypothetical protein [Haliangium ochraceum]ACY13271.1 conserved hypothetical protein [Haliangium ochraceum DSM 14365]
MSKQPETSGNPTGRPKKNSDRRVPYAEVDRLLVFGEVVPCDDGDGTVVEYPSYRELARRFGVSHSVINTYSKRHNCMQRREVAQARVAAKVDQKLTEYRANSIAVTKKDELRIIDSFLSEFEKALSEGRVRCDNAGDFNTMLRLKQFVQGGADSRQELHAALSLEDLQARHRRMLKELEQGPDSPALSERIEPSDLPALSSELESTKVSGHPDGFSTGRPVSQRVLGPASTGGDVAAGEQPGFAPAGEEEA